jgi:hypothetical protein
LDGVFSFSLVLFALSFILLSTYYHLCNLQFYNYKESKWKKSFYISFNNPLFGLGISMGVGAIEMKEFTFTSSPRQDIVLDKKSETFEMTDSVNNEIMGMRLYILKMRRCRIW